MRAIPSERLKSYSSLPALRGGLIALAAAVLFGISTPLIQRFGVDVGSFATASLLYAGAAITGLFSRRPPEREARVERADFKALLWMALFGAGIGPVALAWGLQHTSGVSASLTLTLEAVFTAILAHLWYRESIDRRILLAMTLLTLGGMVLVADSADAGRGQLLGLLAVVGATAAWGIDNALSRSVAERDPGQVVMVKSLFGAMATASVAIAVQEPMPRLSAALALLLIGATGYGLSLRLYLLAQRAFGAARTGSVFAFAPFIGAAIAFALGERSGGVWMLAGGALMACGLALHLAERHEHEHLHSMLEHEHAHRHDDGHHFHVHMPAPEGPHSHRHRHDALAHAHPHVPDEHHQHSHS